MQTFLANKRWLTCCLESVSDKKQLLEEVIGQKREVVVVGLNFLFCVHLGGDFQVNETFSSLNIN